MEDNVNVNIIVAVGNFIPKKGYPIGKDGTIPWHCKNDLKWFKETTMGHPVIMGRKTYESIGKALPGRYNIVVSNTLEIRGINIVTCKSLEEAVYLGKCLGEGDVFIIGGGSLYKEAIYKDLVDVIYMDMLSEDVPDADTFFPEISEIGFSSDNENVVTIEPQYAYAIKYVKERGFDNDVDSQYFNLVRDVLYNGTKKNTRAGMTRSVFGRQVRFDLGKGIPALTTKKIFFKGAIHELLWFLKGDTNIKYLVDNNVHIWDDDAYRHYLQLLEKNKWLYFNGKPHKRENAFSKEVFVEMVKQECVLQMEYCRGNREDYYQFGDLGPVYGNQWRNWNAIDQIQKVIETLKTNPDDRRLLVSAWNVGELDEMALPPCHYSFQFYSEPLNDAERYAWCEKNNITDIFDEYGSFKKGIPHRRLSCMFNMRSNDLALGTPFNWLSYSLLTYMVAQCVGMVPGDLIYNGGDVHVYENQVDALLEQLKRNPNMYALPKLKLNPNKKDIDSFTYEDFEIVGYKSYPSIKIPLSVGL